jgi:hypothetical protein
VIRHLLILNEGEAPRPVRVAPAFDDDSEDAEERD